MNLRPLPILLLAIALPLRSAEAPVELPRLTVSSPRVANQSPVGTFAMPVSALRYEPRVDLQGRNLVEGQADVTIRGGIFENTGFRIGTISMLDPQTGHYFAEIPISPAMLGPVEVLTGTDLAFATMNATVGAVSYSWRPIRTGGAAQIGVGPHALFRGELYQGYTSAPGTGGARLGADLAIAHSQSNGPLAHGDHRFNRLNARIQRNAPGTQSDLVFGYQTKFFGWPNLYTPFNSNESENLQTLLFAANHRVELDGGDYVAFGASHRRNKDDYAFNRFAQLGAVHPFQHTTWQHGVAVEGRRELGGLKWNARAEVLADSLKSTSLTAGRYQSRTLTKAALVPEKAWDLRDGGTVGVRLGATFDDSNRDGGTVSPLFEVARTFSGAAVRRVHLSYTEATQLPTYTALNSSATSGLFRGNRDLGREISQNLEVGVHADAAGWGIEAAVFARRDRGLVDWTFRRGVTARSANALDVDTLGFETVARRQWGPAQLVIGYTALAKSPDYRGANVDASFYALNYARHRLTAAATLQLGSGFELRMDNVARVQAENFLRNAGGDDALLSTATLAYRPAGWRGVEFTVQLDNVWDSRFQEVPAVPAAPRAWSVGATYVW